MKKIATLFFLFLILVFQSNKNNKTTILVNKIGENVYKKVYLKFEDNILTTKNFKNYINARIKVISIYNKNNDISFKRYLFRFKEIDSNLSAYTDYYLNLFGNNTKYYFYGVPIYIVEVDIADTQLNYILSKNSNITYSEYLFGNYH